MSLTLTRRDIDHVGSAPPLYRQLADRILENIDAGDLAPGEKLPSEPDIAEAAGVSRTVVRSAIAELERIGIIVKRHGAVSQVANAPKVRHLDTRRYQAELDLLDRIKAEGGEHPKTSAFVAELDATWDDYSIDVTYILGDPASTQAATRLGIAPGEPVVRRRFAKMVGGETQQLQISLIPMSIAEGTVLADKNAQPFPGGTIAELYAAGYRVDRIVEEANARMPTGVERTALQMVQAAPVWDIVRIMHSGGRAVEVSQVVTPAVANTLRFETDLK